MRISLNWLRDYISWNIPDDELARQLTMLGFEVESVERTGERFDGFVIGEVVECGKHPNADRLSVCRVATGKEVFQVVCGAPNVRAGQKIVLGHSGAVVPRNQHDPDGKPFTLGRATVRGVESFGMICSEYELGLGDDRSGIMLLPQDTVPGTPLADHLGLDDTLFEVGITPNRPDGMSHLGIARELAALLGSPVRFPKSVFRESSGPISGEVTLRIDQPEACPRYTARIIRNVTIGPSPAWMQKRLRAVGIRPVNSVVDSTNYVLMEYGQPLHAFDLAEIAGREIVVKFSSSGEKFTTLDGAERQLDNRTLMICDREKPVAIAGIMGGLNSEISPKTRDVLLESAYFSPQGIRRSSKFLGLSTDASQRFERGADPAITPTAVDRAAALISATGGGEVLRGRLDAYPNKIVPRKVKLRIDRANKILGTEITGAKMRSMLKAIEIRPVSLKSPVKNTLLFQVPTFRPDLEREIDLIEEIARLHGYDNIPTKISAAISFSDRAQSPDIRTEIRDWLVGVGYHEVVVNSLEDKSTANLTTDQLIEIANPISKDLSVLRPSLCPGLLKAVRHNIFHGTSDLRLFELGKIYLRKSGGEGAESLNNFVEEERLGLVVTGLLSPRTWGELPRIADLYDIKGEITTLLKKILLDKFHFIPYSTSTALTHQGLLVEINGEKAGLIGEVRKEILERFEIEQPVYVVDLATSCLERSAVRERTYHPVPRYPSVHRDLAFVVGSGTASEALRDEIRQRGGTMLVNVGLFDIYTGNTIPEGTKSCAFALEFNAGDRTLTQDEVDRITGGIIDSVGRKFNATLRK